MMRRYLATRHSLRVEAATVLILYALYEAARGLVAGNRQLAVDHAHAVTSLEQRLRVFMEPSVQHAAQAVPGLTGVLGAAYLTLHLSVTAALLLWLHQRRPPRLRRSGRRCSLRARSRSSSSCSSPPPRRAWPRSA
jgi:PAP2 superfamily protein